MNLEITPVATKTHRECTDSLETNKPKHYYKHRTVDKAVQTDSCLNTESASACSTQDLSARVKNSEVHQELIKLLTQVEYDKISKEIGNIKSLMTALIDKSDTIVRFKVGRNAIIAVYDGPEKSNLVHKISSVINKIAATSLDQSVRFMRGRARSYQTKQNDEKAEKAEKEFLRDSSRDQVLGKESRYPTVKNSDELAKLFFLDILLEEFIDVNEDAKYFYSQLSACDLFVGINSIGAFGFENYNYFPGLNEILLKNGGFFNSIGFDIFYLYCALFDRWLFEFDRSNPDTSSSFAAGFLSSKEVYSNYDAMKFLAVRSLSMSDLPKFRGSADSIENIKRELEKDTTFGNLNEECKVTMAIKTTNEKLSDFKDLLIKHFCYNSKFFLKIIARKPITDEAFTNRIKQIEGAIDLKKKAEKLENQLKEIESEFETHKRNSDLSECSLLKKRLIQTKHECGHFGNTLPLPPDWLCCPISGEFLQEPVKAPSSHAFEKRSIEKWIDENHTNPMTRSELEKTELQPLSMLEKQTWEWFREKLPKTEEPLEG